jgi:hypothetical protein
MVYGDDVNIMGESVNIIEKNTEDSHVASKENVVELDANKTKYMV